jgi:hypothetical protein
MKIDYQAAASIDSLSRANCMVPQSFLREMLEALDAMPVKRLISEELQDDGGQVCSLGAVGVKRSIDLSSLDPYDYDALGTTFGIAHQLAQEIMFLNDDRYETPENRWHRMRRWVVEQLSKPRDSEPISNGPNEQ